MARTFRFFVLAAAILFIPGLSKAVTLPMNEFLQTNPAIIPFFPVGTVEITDVALDTVRFDISVFPPVEKYDNIGLGLDPSVDESQLVLTPITPDQMTLSHGGWYGFPFKVHFNDNPSTAVAFLLSAPGLDSTDFLQFPGSTLWDTYFAVHLWFYGPGAVKGEDSVTEAHVGNVPEPATLALLAGGVIGAAFARRRKAAA